MEEDKGFAKNLIGDDFVRFKFLLIMANSGDKFFRDPVMAIQSGEFPTLGLKSAIHIAIHKEEATSLANVEKKLITAILRIIGDDGKSSWKVQYTYLQIRMISSLREEQLKQLQLQITTIWTDGEGDEAILATDENLALALDDMSGPIYKFKAYIEKKKKEQIELNYVSEGAPKGFEFPLMATHEVHASLQRYFQTHEKIFRAVDRRFRL